MMLYDCPSLGLPCVSPLLPLDCLQVSCDRPAMLSSITVRSMELKGMQAMGLA